MVTEQAAKELLTRAWQVASAVPDPELPMLTLADLGILREISMDVDHVTVSLTPTYSGCPALTEMRRDVVSRLAKAGFAGTQVRTVLSPPWTTDLMSADGRRKLAEAGVSPPRSGPGADAGRRPGGRLRKPDGPVPLTLFAARPAVACPRCTSDDTERTAAFGSTPCKDLWRCRACGEPFEHVKEV